MAKLGTITFTGVSGIRYTFEIFAWGQAFNPIGAVYFITKCDGQGNHTSIYVGQTRDLSERFDNHHKASCFQRHGANRICVLVEGQEKRRLEIETDLIRSYHPPCNG